MKTSSKIKMTTKMKTSSKMKRYFKNKDDLKIESHDNILFQTNRNGSKSG